MLVVSKLWTLKMLLEKIIEILNELTCIYYSILS